MNIEELKKEYRSVRAPVTAMKKAVGRFEVRYTSGTPLLAWSLVAVLVLGFVIVPKLMEKTPGAAPSTTLSLTGLITPVGPAMPSMTNLTTPTGVEFVVPQLSQISLSPTLLPTLSPNMETI